MALISTGMVMRMTIGRNGGIDLGRVDLLVALFETQQMAYGNRDGDLPD